MKVKKKDLHTVFVLCTVLHVFITFAKFAAFEIVGWTYVIVLRCVDIISGTLPSQQAA